MYKAPLTTGGLFGEGALQESTAVRASSGGGLFDDEDV